MDGQSPRSEFYMEVEFLRSASYMEVQCVIILQNSPWFGLVGELIDKELSFSSFLLLVDFRTFSGMRSC